MLHISRYLWWAKFNAQYIYQTEVNLFHSNVRISRRDFIIAFIVDFLKELVLHVEFHQI